MLFQKHMCTVECPIQETENVEISLYPLVYYCCYLKHYLVHDWHLLCVCVCVCVFRWL